LFNSKLIGRKLGFIPFSDVVRLLQYSGCFVGPVNGNFSWKLFAFRFQTYDWWKILNT